MVGKGPYGNYVMDIRSHAYTDELCGDFHGQKLTSFVRYAHIEYFARTVVCGDSRQGFDGFRFPPMGFTRLERSLNCDLTYLQHIWESSCGCWWLTRVRHAQRRRFLRHACDYRFLNRNQQR